MKHSKKRIQRGGADLVFNIPIKDIQAQILVSPKEKKKSESKQASKSKSMPKPAAAEEIVPEEIVPEQPMITFFERVILDGINFDITSIFKAVKGGVELVQINVTSSKGNININVYTIKREQVGFLFDIKNDLTIKIHNTIEPREGRNVLKFNNVIITQGDVQVTFGLFNIKESFGNSPLDQILPDVAYSWSELAEKEESIKPAFVHNIDILSLPKKEKAHDARMSNLEKRLQGSLKRAQEEKLQALQEQLKAQEEKLNSQA